MTARVETRYAVSDGYHIAYQIHGDGPLTLVSLDQWPSNCEADWDERWYARQLERLGTLARVIRFDARGSGLSDPVVGGTAPGVDEWADDAIAVLDEIGVSRVALWAGGTSSPFAIHVAARESARVQAIVLSDPFARLRYASDHPFGFSEQTIDELLARIRRGWGTGVMLDIYGVAHGENARQAQARYERLAASPGTAAVFAEALCDIDVRADLDSVSAPTLICISKNPVLGFEHGRAIAARIPDATLEEVEDDWRWMDETDLESPSIARIADFLQVRYELHPHRILATVLFTDIVGSTETAADIGDDRWRLLIDTHDREVNRQVRDAGGEVINTTGDGVLAVFGTPTSALRAAIAIRGALATRSLAIRAGLHTGEIEQVGPTVSGLGVHIGARVAALAASGEILVSSTVRQAVSGSGLQFADRGMHQLKGISEQWHLFALAG